MKREFTGEMSMISGQHCLVIGRVTEAGEFLELSPENMRMLVARDAELSEILMRAFILRRLELIRRGWGTLVVLGSQHSARTLEIEAHEKALIKALKSLTSRKRSVDPGILARMALNFRGTI